MTQATSRLLRQIRTLNFVMTLLMIIKRMFILLDKELEKSTPFRKSA